MPEHNPIKEGDVQLTPKQRTFIKAYQENGGNGTHAALTAYDTTDPKVAGEIARENLKKPGVKLAIVDLMEKMGITDEFLLKRTRDIALAESLDTSAKGVKMFYDLKGAWAPTKQDVKQEGNMIVRWATKEELEKDDEQD